ncbi:hypothetical protein BJF85_20545 [Saccharomonospora sp. CUA-673]|uniref:hypothetical protein n=1 Tax=Saccharomonospora sp. CUA-673 TaxID=1904969 RepID=UPI0009658623|nr:hypothetical protein [Saccharomonospora sp. CUA-673]OLT44100.1 hypothetical protein BJF85_20545 [Saccharomonospora sp. CUA-673]
MAAAASVRFCRVDPSASLHERIAATVRVIVTTYSAPGDRIALADATDTASPGSRSAHEHRDRLVETVLRLARGAATEPTPRRFDEHAGEHGDPRRGADSRTESESGFGLPLPDDASTRPARDPRQDRFDVIICGCGWGPPNPSLIADWTPSLASDGALIVLTHSDRPGGGRTARSGAMVRAATLAGLTLTDRLIVARETPSTAPPVTTRARRAVARDGHRRIHASAHVFRPTGP